MSRRSLLRCSGLIIAVLFTAAARAQDAGKHDAPSAGVVQSLQERIQSDPQTMAAVQALRDNPQVQDVLADPAIAEALSRGDIAALLANPKIKRLADDPAVQQVTGQVTK